VIVSGPDRNAAEIFSRALARAAHLPPESPGWGVAPPGALPGDDDIVVFGPAEAPIAMVRGKYRFRLLIKAPRKANVQAFLRQLRARAPKTTNGLKISIDVDPQSFL
jgi:primosomal protein N' (replication factor Y)